MITISKSPTVGSRSRGLVSHGSRSDQGSYKLVPSNEPRATHSAFQDLLEHEEEELRRKGPCPFWSSQEILESNVVQGITVTLILANAIIIGFETDMPHLCHWDVVENVFLVAFTLELSLRMSALGLRSYFKLRNNPDIMWNLFDFSIVGFGIVNVVAGILVGGEHSMGKDATLFRIIRLLRILRVLRIIRIVRFLKQLYLLAYGFLEGTMAVFWVTLLASFMLYICSVILVRTYGRTDDETEDDLFFLEHFGTIPRTMFSLFELISAPDLAPYRAIMFKNPPLVLFLVTFIILGSFGINGLLVALINESILEKNQARLEADRMDRESKRKEMANRCREIFDSIDVNKNRVLPRNELITCTEQIAELFESLGVNFQRKDLDQMFYIMDYNDTGIIERSEFVQGVLELCEQIRPMSIMELHYQVSKCVSKVEQTDVKVEAMAKAGEQHDLKLEYVQRNVERLRRAAENAEACSNQSFSGPPSPTYSAHQRTDGLSRPLREILLEHRRLLTETQARIDAVLERSQQRAAAEASYTALRSLGESLLGLQQSNAEAVAALFGQVWHPARAGDDGDAEVALSASAATSGGSRRASWARPRGMSVTAFASSGWLTPSPPSVPPSVSLPIDMLAGDAGMEAALPRPHSVRGEPSVAAPACGSQLLQPPQMSARC